MSNCAALEELEARVASLDSFTTEELTAVERDIARVGSVLAIVTQRLVQRIRNVELAVEALERPTAYAPGEPDDIDIRSAAEQEAELAFLYTDRDGVQSLRHVTAQEMQSPELLLAYDHDRDHLRRFRVDRIEHARLVA